MTNVVLRSLAPLALLSIAIPARADERSWMVSGFDRVRVEGPFTVSVTTGPAASPRASISGDGRAVERVQVRVQGRTLVVSRDINANPVASGAQGQSAVPPIVISVPSLRGAVLTGDASLTIDRMTGARVDLSVTGPGELTVGRIDADRVVTTLIGNGSIRVEGGQVLTARFQSNGAGTIDAEALSAADLTVIAQGAGEGSFAARTTADIFASGQGAVSVAGAPACKIRGTAPVSCGKVAP